ncbi:unnamed protein product [Symbiodinium microadriaticum]|nr:unnamed protein product [Symbiodinium sp. KB8]CAE7597746.1 unnamed protein product [Symbiodinium microadriaticum]
MSFDTQDFVMRYSGEIPSSWTCYIRSDGTVTIHGYGKWDNCRFLRKLMAQSDASLSCASVTWAMPPSLRYGSGTMDGLQYMCSAPAGSQLWLLQLPAGPAGLDAL